MEKLWLKYFISLFENRIMKPVKIILRGEMGMRENDGGDKPK
jgi:hypothetical protein